MIYEKERDDDFENFIGELTQRIYNIQKEGDSIER
jgi:hypothetical protein